MRLHPRTKRHILAILPLFRLMAEYVVMLAVYATLIITYKILAS